MITTSRRRSCNAYNCRTEIIAIDTVTVNCTQSSRRPLVLPAIERPVLRRDRLCSRRGPPKRTPHMHHTQRSGGGQAGNDQVLPSHPTMRLPRCPQNLYMSCLPRLFCSHPHALHSHLHAILGLVKGLESETRKDRSQQQRQLKR